MCVMMIYKVQSPYNIILLSPEGNTDVIHDLIYIKVSIIIFLWLRTSHVTIFVNDHNLIMIHFFMNISSLVHFCFKFKI